MTIFFMVIVMILTPIIYEKLNQKVSKNLTIVNKLSGLPSYSLMLGLCVLEGLAVCLIPTKLGGWGFTLTHWLFATAVIYLGNQIVFNFAVKIMSVARRKMAMLSERL